MAEYIERGKAIAMRFTDGIEEDGLIYVPWRDVAAHLKSLPAADVRENVQGEWIYDGEYDEYSDNIWKCSHCEHTWNFIGGRFSHPLDYDANYCPNCGADMRGEKNG